GGDQRRLVIQDGGERLARVRGPQLGELRQSGRVERARLDTLNAQRSQTRLQLVRRFLGERDRQDLLGREGAGGDLAGHAVRDGGGFARTRAGEDRDGAADSRGGRSLGF